MPTVLAVDLGGTKTAIARIDEEGAISDRQTFPSARALPDSVEQIAAIVRTTRHVDAIGIIVPGIYAPIEGTAWCPNLWGTDHVPLRKALKDAIHTRVLIDSDRSGYVLGEAWMGAARGLRHVVFVGIGTGIGVGILSDGMVIRGAAGIAGATGWFALNPEWNAAYEALGCWEAESSGPAIARKARLPDARAVVEAARAGDEAALRVLRRAAHYTAMGVANLISALNPEAVVLGGGLLAGAGDLLLEWIRSEVPRWAQPIAAGRCRIELTRLGDDAGLFGAAKLALDGI
jgi:glucokinase